MPARPSRRTLIGSSAQLASWQRVYETPDAVEVDEGTGFTGTRQRVFYDEVLLVTYHSFVGWALAALAAMIATGIGLVAAGTALAGQPRATVIIFLFALLPLAFAVVRVVVKVDAVTVHGRRSRARVCFWLRKGKARAAFQRLCARVRHAQERAAREAAAQRQRTLPTPGAPGPAEVAS